MTAGVFIVIAVAALVPSFWSLAYGLPTEAETPNGRGNAATGRKSAAEVMAMALERASVGE